MLLADMRRALEVLAKQPEPLHTADSAQSFHH
jgi:hypothetical protein